MPFVMRDSVRLYVEVTGQGPPIVFAHESAADHRQWAGQVAALSYHYRCITYNARGYPPSDVPDEDCAYGHEQAWRDLAHVVEHVAETSAHIIGLSMGAYAGLMLGSHRPDLVASLVLAGCGTGSTREPNGALRAAMVALADIFETEGNEAGARQIARPGNRTCVSKAPMVSPPSMFRHTMGGRRTPPLSSSHSTSLAPKQPSSSSPPRQHRP